jgi:hypothetical protein
LRSRQTALVKDLTRLLTKYSARDWAPILHLLTSNPSLLVGVASARSSETKASLENRSGAKERRAASAKKATKSQPTRKRVKAASAKSQKSKAVKAKLKTRAGQDDSQYRNLLSKASISQLQTLFLQIYRDKRIPKSRSEITATLDHHLRKLPQDERAALMQSLSPAPIDSTENFQRWADIISKGKTEGRG